ncbi:accessory gene regulator B family protein, partial [Enterococcus columbae]
MKILEFFTQKLIRKLIKYQLISDQDVNLYSYGINLLLSYLLNLFTILLIGLLENKFIETIFFTAIFVFIRSYSGGLHFSKFIYCYIGTVIVI